MSFANILGRLLEQGLPGQTQTGSRMGGAARTISAGGQGLDQILGSLQSALGGASRSEAGSAAAGGAQGQPMADLARIAQDFLQRPQAGGMSGAQLGGLGALAGALLGGGGQAVRGAAGGGAMAILGALALAALNHRSRAPGPAASRLAQGAPTAADVQALVSTDGEQLALRAMIAAAKADGTIDQSEMTRILGQLKSDEVSAEERRFVLDEIGKPLDAREIARDVRSPAQAAEVYAASLLAIDIDSEAEREYLRGLAQALELDPGVVRFLHQSTGAPIT